MQFDHFLAWTLHVTQAKNLSFPYLKSYCPLNFRKSHQISWLCCIPYGSYKEDNLKEGRIPCGIGFNFELGSDCFQKYCRFLLVTRLDLTLLGLGEGGWPPEDFC